MMSGSERGDEPTPVSDDAAARRTLRTRLTAWWRVRTYRFAVQFGLFLLAIALSYPALRGELASLVTSLEATTAELVAQVLGFFSSDVALRNDRIVSLGTFSVTIIDECAGIYEMLIFSAAVLAYPTSWARAAVGLGLGIPLLYAMNLARIAGLLLVGRQHPAAFEFMHLYFWQVTMLIMIGGTWLLWLLWVVRDEEAPARSG